MRRLALLFLLIVSVAARCWRIDAPFDDLWSWRQSDVAAIARNYFEGGFHFSRPQIDWAGGEPGYVGTEFPLLPFVAALLYKIFSVHEWIGRSLTITFFATSLPFVFFLARRVFDEFAAILALVFYSFAPLMMATSRAFMPDVPSLACAIAGLYFFWRWLDAAPAAGDSESFREQAAGSYSVCSYFAASILIALALLLKPTTAMIAAPMTALIWRKFGRDIFFQRPLWLFAFLVLIPSALWYWHACAIAREFYPHHMFGAGGVRVMDVAWYWRILRLTFLSSLTPVLFVLGLIGFIATARKTPFHWWLIAMIPFVILVGYGNRHEWYRLPLVPIAAVFAGAALSFLRQKPGGQIAFIAALILFGFSSFFQSSKYIEPVSRPLGDLGHTLREHTSPNALIIIADDGDPTALYYAHRKGWHFLERDGIYDGDPYDGAQLIADLENLRRRRATHVALYRGTIWWLDYYPEFADYLARSSSLEVASTATRIYKLKTE